MGSVAIRFKGKLISLFTEARRLPNGTRVRLEIIRHPGASLIVPFLNKDRIILLRQFRPVVNAYLYELPAGTLNKNETPLECARREVAEETGYRASRLRRLGFIYPVPGYSTEKITIYKAEGLIRQESCPEADEVIKTLSVSGRQVRSLFKKGRIIDAKTICALALCGWL
ncbi:MAG TPA: NUDIX hydrolase [Patescibacteria group bacterium]|nr:NUDIX hydrolase [Patescibacteria group bacterium]